MAVSIERGLNLSPYVQIFAVYLISTYFNCNNLGPFVDIRLEYVECGSAKDPLVLLLHGWPEGWGSWANIAAPISTRGYHVVAPSLRGYGFSSCPADPKLYSADIILEDIIALIAATGHSTVKCLVGHDWGAILTWHFATLQPTMFETIYVISVPLGPLGHPDNSLEVDSTIPTDAWREVHRDDFFYILYMCEVDGLDGPFSGPAAREYTARAEELHDRLIRNYVNDAKGIQVSRWTQISTIWWIMKQVAGVASKKRSAGGLIDRLPPWNGHSEWISADDRRHWLHQHKHSGFNGLVNYYRNFDTNKRLLLDRGLYPINVQQPCAFLAGEDDQVITSLVPDDWCETMCAAVPNIYRPDGSKRVELVPNNGHFILKENPRRCAEAITEFLQELIHVREGDAS